MTVSKGTANLTIVSRIEVLSSVSGITNAP